MLVAWDPHDNSANVYMAVNDPLGGPKLATAQLSGIEIDDGGV
jgi:hypothetical protein